MPKPFISGFIQQRLNDEIIGAMVEKHGTIKDECTKLLRERPQAAIITFQFVRIKAIQNILAAENELAFLAAKRGFSEIEKKHRETCAEFVFEYKEHFPSQDFKEIMDLCKKEVDIMNEHISEVDQALKDT